MAHHSASRPPRAISSGCDPDSTILSFRQAFNESPGAGVDGRAAHRVIGGIPAPSPERLLSGTVALNRPGTYRNPAAQFLDG